MVGELTFRVFSQQSEVSGSELHFSLVFLLVLIILVTDSEIENGEYSMVDYRFYGFTENLIKKVLDDFPSDGTVFIFPTESSKKIGMSLFQKNWQFSDTLFQTLEELKENLFVISSLPLREERRNLALYHTLSEDQKKRLKISNYFQFISFASDFFTFWEEFTEEEIDPEHCLDTLLKSGDEILNWQSELYSLMSDIRSSYGEFLRERNWTDRIFLYRIENLTFDHYRSYRRIVFVNQHYYTQLENRLLNAMANAGFEVTVCYQLDESFIDQEKNRLLDRPSFPMANLQDRLTERIEIYRAPNDFSMYGKFVETLSEQGNLSKAFDNRFYQSSYSSFFSPSRFGGLSTRPLLNSQPAIFISCLAELLEGIHFEPERKRELIPLDILLRQLSEPVFISYIVPDKNRQELLIQLIEMLIHHNLSYFDLQPDMDQYYQHGRFLKRAEWDLLTGALSLIRTLLERLRGVDSIATLIHLIDIDDGLDLRRTISSDELEYSNTAEILYTALSDFSRLDNLELIENKTFWCEGRVRNRYTVCSGILKLLILYLRPRSVTWYYNTEIAGEPSHYRREISSLLDSRNLCLEHVAILNASEGVLPAAQSTPFLFTEAQRRKLGLKTYEDIRYWEKYYFFRLILNSREVYIFAQQNRNQNVEISSFIEELKLLFQNEKTISIIDETEPLPDQGYSEYYTEVSKPDKEYIINRDVLNDPEFYSIPLNIDRDLKDHTLILSYSSFSKLNDSPFSYYLKQIAGVEEEYRLTPFSPTLIGSIVHQLIERIWQIIPEPEEDDLTTYFENLPATAGGILKNNRDNFLKTDFLYYRIPHTYNYRFFREIFLPIVEEGIVAFFSLLSQIIKGRQGKLEINHEVREPDRILPLISDSEWEVYLKGRADLLIRYNNDFLEEPCTYIFDYKTGSLNNKKSLLRQLVIYELIFCYLTEQGSISNNDTGWVINHKEHIESYIYSLNEGKLIEMSQLSKKKSKDEIIGDFINDTETLVEKIRLHGWFGLTTRPEYIMFPEIIRTDLLIKHLDIKKIWNDKEVTK